MLLYPRRIPDPVLRDAAVRRASAVLHGAGAGAVPSLRLPNAVEEDLPCFERFVRVVVSCRTMQI